MPEPRAFTHPGQPLPKGRPRFRKNGSVYTPPKTRQAEDALAWSYRQQFPGAPPMEGDLKVTCTFWRHGHVRADLDNLLKLTMDALNGLAWKDDKQIVMTGEHRVIYGSQVPATDVLIESLGEE